MNACSSAELFCRTNDRIKFGCVRPDSLRTPGERSDVVNHRVVVPVDASGLENLLPARIDADVDGIETGIDHPARNSSVMSEPLRSFDFRDALRTWRIAPFRRDLVEEGLA